MVWTPRRVTKTILGVALCYGLASLIVQIFHSTASKDRGDVFILSPRNSVLFLKTHKTGSSTVINLFQRYAYLNDLTVALPSKDDIFLGWPHLLTDIPSTVLDLRNASRKFDYIINHVVYKEALISPLYKSNPIRVSVVRDPNEQLRSSFNYYNILRDEGEIGMSVVDMMESFFKDPERFDKVYFMEEWFVKSKTKNPQLADLGLEYEKMASKNQMREHVNIIVDNFDLIMVTEMMDESCLLLKRLMRWKLTDVIYQNKYKLTYPAQTAMLPDNLKREMFQWNWGDNLLYWKAKERLLKLMSSEPRFQEELANFREIKSKVIDRCANISSTVPLEIEKTVWNENFIVNSEYCAHILRTERPFTRLLQWKQRPDIYNMEYYEKIEDPQLHAVIKVRKHT